MMGIMVPEKCWASNKICNKYHLLHLVGILFPHINEDARSESLQIFSRPSSIVITRITPHGVSDTCFLLQVNYDQTVKKWKDVCHYTMTVKKARVNISSDSYVEPLPKMYTTPPPPPQTVTWFVAFNLTPASFPALTTTRCVLIHNSAVLTLKQFWKSMELKHHPFSDISEQEI